MYNAFTPGRRSGLTWIEVYRRGLQSLVTLLLGCPWRQQPIRNYLPSISGKRQNGGRNSQKALRKPFPFSGADFLGEGTGHFRLSGEQIWKLIWTNTKLFRGVFGPMSTPNDYLNTVFDDVVSLCESCRNSALLRPHGKSFNLLQFSPGAWKVFPYKKGIFYL